MTRKSAREIEQRLEELSVDSPDQPVSDIGMGVTAPFVTYESDADGTTYRVVEPGADSAGDAQ